jgi:hypothetical protein
MKRVVLLFGLIFSLVAVNANAVEAPTNAVKARTQSLSMQKVLTLSDQQREKVEAVLLSKYDAIDAVINDINTDGAAKRAALEAINVQKDAELKTIMTPDQYALFLKKREEARVRKDGGH